MELKKIVYMNRTKCEAIEFNSVNDIVKVKIEEDNCPLLVLEDNSLVIFSDVATYFDLSINSGIKDNYLNISVLDLQYDHINDDVARIYYNNREIIEVTKYSRGNVFIYRLFTN